MKPMAMSVRAINFRIARAALSGCEPSGPAQASVMTVSIAETAAVSAGGAAAPPRRSGALEEPAAAQRHRGKAWDDRRCRSPCCRAECELTGAQPPSMDASGNRHQACSIAWPRSPASHQTRPRHIPERRGLARY